MRPNGFCPARRAAARDADRPSPPTSRRDANPGQNGSVAPCDGSASRRARRGDTHVAPLKDVDRYHFPTRTEHHAAEMSAAIHIRPVTPPDRRRLVACARSPLTVPPSLSVRDPTQPPARPTVQESNAMDGLDRRTARGSHQTTPRARRLLREPSRRRRIAPRSLASSPTVPQLRRDWTIILATPSSRRWRGPRP